MGFHIRIDEDTKNLMENLKTDPSEIFQDVYDCYFLFLIGGSDKDATQWIVDNMLHLDSLTGKDIAFGVFLREINIKLNTSSSHGPSRNAGAIPLNELKTQDRVERVIKNYTDSYINDGDYITALTYATDELARIFHVIDKLPCLILIDPIPQEKFSVVELSDEICSQFIPILRRAISKYHEAIEGKSDLKEYVRRVINSQNKIIEFQNRETLYSENKEQLLAKLENLKRKKLSLDYKHNINMRFALAQSALNKGAIKQFKTAILGGPSKTSLYLDINDINIITTCLDKCGETLRALTRTIDAIAEYVNVESLELDQIWVRRVHFILENYVVNLIELPSYKLDDLSIEYCKEIYNKLQKKKNEMIELIMSKVPNKDYLETTFLEKFWQSNEKNILYYEEELKRLKLEEDLHKRDYSINLKVLEDTRDKAIESYRNFNSIFFSDIFIDEIKILKLGKYISKTKNAVSTFGANLFKPETIMKLFEFFSKLAG
jgi:hypothetical protein